VKEEFLIMKITGNNPFVNLEVHLKNIRDGQKVDASAKQAPKQVLKEDTVVLSPEAKKIQEVRKLLNTVPDIRGEKVARIKAQIGDGTYHVDGEKLAEKIIKESLLNEVLGEVKPRP
jgi:negative regulator of flagellin synthesis FlgM